MLHEARLFELAGTLTIEVEFIVTDVEAKQLLKLIHAEKLRPSFLRSGGRIILDLDEAREIARVVANAFQ